MTATDLYKIEIKKILHTFIQEMVAFSKYALLGDLIITPILQAVEALPTELVSYIGGYVTPTMTQCERLKERYENIYGELQHIHSRQRPDLIEYAKANFTRFGFKETTKTYKTDQLGKKAYRKETDMRIFSDKIKDMLDSQAYRFIRRIKYQYDTLKGFYDEFPMKDYAQVSLKLKTIYTSINGKTYTAKSILGDPKREMISIQWNEDFRCIINLSVGITSSECYCPICCP